jgi:polyribonucleotide nucleotidyltransferase
VIATVLSHDRENDPDVISLLGASTALVLSDIPWNGPIAAVRIGRIGGKFVINPTTSQLVDSDMNIIVAGSRDAIVMVEGGASMVAEAVVLEALMTAHESLQPLITLQENLRGLVGKPKRTVTAPVVDAELERRVREAALPELRTALAKSGKHERYAGLDAARDAVIGSVGDGTPERAKQVATLFDKLKKEVVRETIIHEGRRLDGRGLGDVRPITCEVEILPRTHGSALFTRGETQALVVSTLGTSSDEQKIDALIGETYKKFMLHYNFPPFSTGEVKFLRSPGRREIGHGALAERALVPVLPSEDEFPYTIRIVSEVLESNGSSSMATVCGGSLSLMDAGVPVKAPVAGVAMGLIKEGDQVRVLSDILGDEDHLGDMDFKIAGSEQGVTAVQMDIKIAGTTRAIMQQALAEARTARLHILGIMNQTLARPRGELSSLRAPDRHHPHQAGSHPRPHRPGRQGHPRHHRGDRRQDRRRGRRHGLRRVRPTACRCRRRSTRSAPSRPRPRSGRSTAARCGRSSTSVRSSRSSRARTASSTSRSSRTSACARSPTSSRRATSSASRSSRSTARARSASRGRRR